MDVAISAVVGLTLLAAGVWRPGWFAAGAILSAPLHVYRRPLPEVVWGIDLPQLNLSIFRGCVLIAAVGLMVHLLHHWRQSKALTQEISRSDILYLSAITIGAIWLAYESTRSLWPLGQTLAAADIFFLFAVVVLAATLIFRLLSAATALTAAACSAILPVGYALFQFIEPSTAVEKYNRPVPLADLLDLQLGTDQARAGGLTGESLFRPAAFFSDPNFLAIFAAGTFALIEPGKWVSKGWQRRALQALRVLAALVVFVTLSRTGLIVLGACLIARYGRVVLAHLRVVQDRLGTIFAVLIVLVTLALTVSGALVVNDLKGSESTSSHAQTARDAVDLWRRFPIIGAGLGNFGYAYGQAPDRSSAQSFPFTVVAEQGAIGLLIFAVIFWGSAIRLAVRPNGLEQVPLGLIFLIGAWFYDFPLALDVCAVWLAFLWAAFHIESLRLPVLYPLYRR